MEKESLPYRMGTAEEDIRWTVYVYDGHDRMDSVVYPDGSSERFTYNGLETACTATPPQGSSNATPRRTAKRLNVLGWTIENEDADGTTVSYEYFADGSPKWARVGSDETTKVSMEYDNAGNRTRLHDPDYCTAQSDLVSEYDAFGQEVRRTTPRQFTSTFTYDRYGRTTGRSEDDGAADGTPVSRTTTWQYGETAPRKGLLLSVSHPEQSVSYAYDTCQRRICDTVRIAGAAYVTRYDYDRASRIASVTYPSGFTVKQRYNASGYPCVQTDADGKELYRTKETSPLGQSERFSLGGILDNTLEYDPERNLVTAMKTKKGTATLQDLLCGYDGFRNLASRKDNRIDMEETFTYDDMDRLTGVCLGTAPTGAMAYDGYGRMTSKTAGGNPVFSDAVFGAASKPHAMDRAFTPSGTFPSTPQTVSYTGFDKVLKVKQGNDSVVFAYGHDHQRIAMEEHVGNTLRTKRYVGNCELVSESSGLLNTERWLTCLTGPTGVYAVVETSGSVSTLHYVLKDNLGSWTTITDSDGNVEQRLSYDAWGNLRDPATWSGSFTGTPMFDRGFTGHEHLYEFGLINMNGRMYDPVMSSFLSVDQYVQDPSSAQGFNRYAYCGHNPLRYVDPSGWQMKPNPGSSPSSNDYYQDIYSYVERAYEPRDLGILQLSTDDPIVIWMEENELHGGSGAKGGWYLSDNEICWNPMISSQSDLNKLGIDGTFVGPKFTDELNHVYYSILGYRIDMNEGNGLAGKIAPLIDEAFINYEAYKKEMLLFDPNSIGDEPQQKWTDFITVIAYNDKIGGLQQYCFSLGPIECHLMVGKTEKSMQARIEQVNLDKTKPDLNNGYGFVKWSSGYDINFISKASYYDTNPKNSRTVVLIVPPSHWNNFKTRYNSVFPFNKP